MCMAYIPLPQPESLNCFKVEHPFFGLARHSPLVILPLDFPYVRVTLKGDSNPLLAYKPLATIPLMVSFGPGIRGSFQRNHDYNNPPTLDP